MPKTKMMPHNTMIVSLISQYFMLNTKYLMPSSSVRCALVTTMMPHDTYRRPFALNDFIVRPYFLSTKCLKRKYQYTPIFFPKTKPRIGFINFMSQALIPDTRTLFCSYNDKTTVLFKV